MKTVSTVWTSHAVNANKLVFCISECCDNNNVQEPCKVACAFDVDFKEIMNMTDCLPDLPSIIGCAAGESSGNMLHVLVIVR